MSIVFVDNLAEIGGAALYISDIRGCFWLDSSFDVDDRYTIFTPPPNASSPFTFRYVGTYGCVCTWNAWVWVWCVGVYAVCKGYVICVRV